MLRITMPADIEAPRLADEFAEYIRHNAGFEAFDYVISLIKQGERPPAQDGIATLCEGLDALQVSKNDIDSTQ